MIMRKKQRLATRSSIMAAPRLLAALVIMTAVPASAGKQGGMSDLERAHRGTVEIDTDLLNRAPQPAPVRAFFDAAHQAMEANPKARLADVPEISRAANKNGLTHLGGPMLGCLSADGARVWVRTVKPAKITVLVRLAGEERRFGPVASTVDSDLTAVVPVTGLEPATRHPYRVLVDDTPITMPANAVITTAPAPGPATGMRIAFAADFHKSGLWKPELMESIRTRGNLAMLLLGDSAVDDRENRVGMHRLDYLLRDLSPYWQQLAASVPIYAVWDDHDYFNNDLSGIPPRFTAADRAAVRTVWRQSWNNPACGFEDRNEGIFFRTRIGPCDVIMLDTRFFRSSPGHADSFLGQSQMRWLDKQLTSCTGPFIILTSGTMWSDYVTNGKDSWGRWDPPAREHIFSFIEEHRICGVLLLSGDRHGARVMNIPRPSGFMFREFEMGSLGAHEGPGAMGNQPSLQPFGVVKTFAFGEFTFETAAADPTVTFRAVGADGNTIHTSTLTRSQLTPPGK
jgi:alkaline phosphatase D